MSVYTNKKISKFFKQYKSLQIKKGEIILRPDQTIKEIFYIKKGLVRLFTITKDGEEVTMSIFSPGSYFPMMLYLTDRPNKYHFESVSDLSIYSAPASAVLTFVKTNPDVLLELTNRFALGLCGMMERIESLNSTNSQEKILNFIYYMAKRFGKQDKEGTLIDLPISQTDISSWLGIKRETISRQMQQLKEKNILKYKDRSILISDIESIPELRA